MSDAPEPVIVPYERLSPAALRALVLERATRDGTDYGEVEAALATKVRQLEEQLRRGDAVITFDPVTETCSIVDRRELDRRPEPSF